MKKLTATEKKNLLKKVIKFCIKNDLMYEEMPIVDFEKFSPEIHIFIPNWKK